MQVPIGDTYYFKFTTRAFASGVPTTLAGTPVISVYEEGNLTQITAGITLTADYDSVTGLNDVAVVATSANGYEVGKYYNAVITTGTVSSVSVVGETVGHFRIMEAEGVAGVPDVNTTHVADTAQTANDNGADINAILVDTNSLNDTKIPQTLNLTALGNIGIDWANVENPTTAVDLAATDIQLVDTCTTNTDMRGTDNAATATALAATEAKIDIIDTNVDSILADTADMQPKLGTPAADLSADIAAVKSDSAAILTDTGTTIPATLGTPAGADMSADIAAVKVDTAATLVDTAEIGVAGAGLTDLGGMSTGMKAEVNVEADTALSDYDPPTNAEMEARTPTAAQLAYIVSNAADGLPVTFTGGTTTTAILGNVDGAAASSTDDVYNGRVLVFNAGTLDQQVTDITDYDGGTKTATITAVTTAVTSGHTANMK